MPAPRRAPEPGAHRPHAHRMLLLRPGPARRAAEPLAWWAGLLAVYLGLVSTISVTEITVAAVAAAAGAAAAVAARRALLSTGTARDLEGGREPAADRVPAVRPVPPARLAAPLARLPGQVVADTARVIVRGAGGGDWTVLAVAPGPADRGAATLLMSVSPGTYVGGVDPERGLLRVHRLAPGASPFERRLRAAALVGGPDGEAP
ncbi:hypothetical protein [Actinomadura latina]|nr:hypothetical protein [Actinomadura latina]